MAAKSQMCSKVCVENLASNLKPNILDELAMYLNPRMPLKDYKTLAGKLGYSFLRVRNFERDHNPTVSLLEDWWTSYGKKGEAKTVSELVKILEEMKRDDAASLLRPYEFIEIEIPPPEYSRSSPRFKFAAYSYNDIIPETRLPEENEFCFPGYSGTAEAIGTVVQTEIEHIIHPNSMASSMSEPRAQVRHPATIEQVQNRQQNEQQRVRTQENPPKVNENPHMRNTHVMDSVRHPATIEQVQNRQQNEQQRVRTQENPPKVNENPHMRNTHVMDSVPRPGFMQVPRPMEPPVILDKVALVMGNMEYECERLRGLLYPERDAQEIAEALGQLGFKVVSLVNLSLSEMRIAVLSFCRLLGKGVYAVLYYGGHGYEDGGENFLVPVDADLLYKREDSLCAQEILQTMQECDTALNLLIIDSCRIRLPDRGQRPTFVKRSGKGNNIFAYSCCSQQVAHEEHDQTNGLYAQHLLRHIRRNVRIEHILMDVATDVSLAIDPRINQRPCHESDAYLDCRLTDPIYPNVLPNEFTERVALWQKAHTLPEPFIALQTKYLVVGMEFRANFSNVMEVLMTASNKTAFPMTRFVMDLGVQSPVRSDVISLSSDLLAPYSNVKQVVKLSALQKLPDQLLARLQLFYDFNGKQESLKTDLNLGFPLVSSVFTEWDWWVTCGRSPPTKSTQV